MISGKNFVDAKQVVERGMGCWNCKHFDNGDMAKEYYRACKIKEIARLQEQGQIEPVKRLSDDEASHKQVQKLVMQGYSQEQAINIATALAAREKAMSRMSMVSEGQIKQESARFQRFDQELACGNLGMCRIGGAQSDFVMHQYLCNKWDGRDGHSVAREGKTDLLPQEEREKRGLV